MAMACDACGTKTNEIKSGGGIEDKGRQITLKMTDISDLSRDVLRVGHRSKVILGDSSNQALNLPISGFNKGRDNHEMQSITMAYNVDLK